ncbi:MAG: hypothetical protein ABJN69_09370 [Hellea sp.]
MSVAFGHVIKHWRDIRRFSQLALSVESGMSSRHISFLETGRSRPSRNSVMTLARVLEMPKPAVNEALLAAGFAPEYKALAMDAADLAPAMSAMMTMLENHAPMPAIILDGGWNIVGGNSPAQHMIQFMPFKGSLCVVEALLNDDPRDPCFLNWPVMATWSLLRLQAEISRDGPDSPLTDLHRRLATDPRVSESDLESFSDYGPILTLQVKADEHVLTLFTMLAEFSTAQDLTLSERKVELFFAADEVTKTYFHNLQIP